MSHDDDTLAHIDLSAWDAPPPPANLADAVIERMGSADAGIAIPVEGPRESRRVWIVGAAAVAAAMLAIAAWSLLRSPASSAPATGAVLAERARSLTLDGVQAELDPGADVRWRRDGDVLHVEQRAGTVAWRVTGERKLVIDAGAKRASVEATGANLRVEVQMNAMDTRVIGASALTAAAVAMVTVVVYEGHVGVHQAGRQTVVVAPGSTYEIKPEQEPPVVGATVDPAHRPRIAILGLELLDSRYQQDDAPVITRVFGATLRAAAQADGSYQLPLTSDKELVDLKLLMNCDSEAPECMAAMGADLGVDALVYGHVEPVGAGYRITLRLLDVAGKAVVKEGAWVVPAAEAVGTGFDTWGRKMYAALVHGAATTCDPLALKEQGMQAVNQGDHEAALDLFERSFACKFDSSVLQLAFMESCNAGNSAKAKHYFKQLSQLQKNTFAQICIRNHVEYEDDDSDDSCDEVSCVLNDYAGACCAKYKQEADAAKGSLRLESTPKARIRIDGRDLRLTTPARVVALEPGKHKVTFVVGDDWFTYPVTVEANKTLTLSKDFSDRVPASAAKSCDADEPKQQGMQYINQGKHAAALAQFEKALACKRDPYVIQLAFMEACSSNNSAKAKLYYKQMTLAQQQKFAQICQRQKVEYQ